MSAFQRSQSLWRYFTVGVLRQPEKTGLPDPKRGATAVMEWATMCQTLQHHKGVYSVCVITLSARTAGLKYPLFLVAVKMILATQK